MLHLQFLKGRKTTMASTQLFLIERELSPLELTLCEDSSPPLKKGREACTHLIETLITWGLKEE